jgi:predicted transcriptional regulator YdeE
MIAYAYEFSSERVTSISLSRMQPTIRTNVFLLALFGLIASQSPLGGQAPETPVTHETIGKPFYVAGWLIRTNNADEAGGNGKIGPLWQRIMQQNLAQQIPNRTDGALIVVYSNYASDEKGDYDYLFGARVSSVDNLSAGMTSRKVEPGSYAAILTDKGQMPGVLQAAWTRIWKMTPAELGGKRTFLTDYEVYDDRSANMQSAQVEIHVGLAPMAH